MYYMYTSIWIKKKNKQKFLDARSVFDITNW